ncbi:MAG: hypothetical protein FJY10_07725 [Bacteroidetes bacterium]|nr:hypothetical protein [Bacteroidota bacterium]
MRTPFTRFLNKLIIFTIIIAAVGFLLRFFLPAGWISPAFPYLVLLFFSLTLIVHAILIRISGMKFSGFQRNFLLLTMLKLLFLALVMVIYVFINRTDAVSFGVLFLALYIFYSVFEIVSLLSHFKRSS